jgi:hypothetical protein
MQPRAAIEYAAEVIERKMTRPGPKSEALALLSIFGERAFPALDVTRIIGSEKMKESRILRRAREEGQLIAHRAAILRVLRARFGATATAEFTGALDEIDELARLELLVDLAATCRDMAGFRAGFQTQGATP